MPLAGRLVRPLQHLSLGLAGSGVAPGGAKLPTRLSPPWAAQQSGTANVSVAFTPQAVNVGDFVIIGGGARGATLPTGLGLASSLGNTYAQIGGPTTNNNATAVSGLWAGFVSVPGTETLTLSWTNAGAGVGTAVRYGTIGGTTGPTALDIALIVNALSTAPGSSGASAATASANDLVIACTIQNGTSTQANQAFTPAGTGIAVPDTLAQTTGTDNCQAVFSETISGSAGATQSYAYTGGANGQWVVFLACFKHA